MKNKQLTVLTHILCCLVFLSVPVLSPPPGYKFSEALLSLPYLRELLGYMVTILFFYISYLYLIPRYYFRKKYLLFSIFSILGYALCAALPNLLDLFYPQGYDLRPQDTSHDIIGHIAHNFLRFALVFFISLLVKINEQYKKAQKEKTEAELAYLKTQINPHFLFNTLNTIYSLAVEQSKETANAVVKLSGMMRYVLKETTRDHIPLDVELEYIQSYIDLQQGRFVNTIALSYTLTGDPNGKRIAPLLLMPFIENAFKHGINPEEDSRITITMNISDDELRLSIVNNIVSIQKEEPRSGIGIENTKSRLGLLYPGAHWLTVSKQNGIFIVDLSLRLK